MAKLSKPCFDALDNYIGARNKYFIYTHNCRLHNGIDCNKAPKAEKDSIKYEKQIKSRCVL